MKTAISLPEPLFKRPNNSVIAVELRLIFELLPAQ
jgi:hypothetical protein